MGGIGDRCSGQASLEYALVLFAFLASLAAMGAVLGLLRSPTTFDTAVESSAHVYAESDPVGSAQDLAVF